MAGVWDRGIGAKPLRVLLPYILASQHSGLRPGERLSDRTRRPAPARQCHLPRPAGRPELRQADTRASAQVPARLRAPTASPGPGQTRRPPEVCASCGQSPPLCAAAPPAHLQLLVRVLLRVLAALALFAQLLQLGLALVQSVPPAPLLRLVLLERGLRGQRCEPRPCSWLLGPRSGWGRHEPGTWSQWVREWARVPGSGHHATVFTHSPQVGTGEPGSGVSLGRIGRSEEPLGAGGRGYLHSGTWSPAPPSAPAG